MVEGPEQAVDPITGPQLTAAFRASGPTAAGLDSRAPRELGWVGGTPAQLLADLLNCIEKDGAWPRQLCEVRC
eukprot:7924541-Alexandrium_andersonii.AAC.1